MKAKTGVNISELVLDPESPWKLPQLKSEFPNYEYILTAADWRGKLGRAEQGDVDAQCYVAMMYDYGCKNHTGRILVRRSARKAAEWYRRSSEQGSAIGQTVLANFLSARGATEANRREAILLYRKAFRGGASFAANSLAITYRDGGDLRRAMHWFRKSAASKDDDGAYIQLGIHYYWGKGVRADHAEAVRCFRKATEGKRIAEAERDDAFFYLGIAYLEGNGVKASSLKGRKLLERANIDNDHLAASRLLKRLKARPAAIS